MGRVSKSCWGTPSATATAVQAKGNELRLISHLVWDTPLNIRIASVRERAAWHFEQANMLNCQEHFNAWRNLIRVQSIEAATMAKEYQE